MMNALVECLESPTYKIGLFSSPTGTGKSSSLLCGILRHVTTVNASMASRETTIDTKNDQEEDWVLQHVKQKRDKENERQRELQALKT